MSTWRRSARLLIAVFAVVFAVIVALGFKRRAPVASAPAVARTDPNAIVESTAGRVMRFKAGREDVSVEYDKQLTYANGSTKLMGVRVATDERNGERTFTVTGKEGDVGQNESTIALNGDVSLTASDGLHAQTEHATYADADGIVRAPGPVEFTRKRMSGSGVGMTYDKNLDVLVILDQAIIHLAPDAPESGPTDVASGEATIARRDKYLRFERGMKTNRGGQIIEADGATAYLTADNEHIESVELRGNARITASKVEVGGLQALTGRDMNLKYRADGGVLEHALIVGNAVVQLAGEAAASGRQITADTLDITLAPDGSTPTALVARDNVVLTFPAEGRTAARTIRAASLDAKGEAGKGLTTAQFAGSVQYRERGNGIDRAARSEALDVMLKPAMSSIQEARFLRAVRFEEGTLAATAALGRYDLDKGLLELSGSEPGRPTPHVVNDQIAVDAPRIDLTLVGPKMKASGNVKSVLQPAKTGAQKSDTKVPSMLKADQPVNVVGTELDYDGAASTATYTGNAQLWQIDTSVKAGSITIDDKSGDLAATGAVTTATVLEQVDKNNKKERVRSIGTSKTFTYTEALRRATYVGDAHLSGPQGDMTADKVELFLKPSGDELDRAEGYDQITLREQHRKTTGTRLTYTTSDDRYLVTGAPVKVVDECGRETVGKTLTFLKATDTITVDGNGYRTQTTGGGQCP